MRFLALAIATRPHPPLSTVGLHAGLLTGLLATCLSLGCSKDTPSDAVLPAATPSVTEPDATTAPGTSPSETGAPSNDTTESTTQPPGSSTPAPPSTPDSTSSAGGASAGGSSAAIPDASAGAANGGAGGTSMNGSSGSSGGPPTASGGSESTPDAGETGAGGADNPPAANTGPLVVYIGGYGDAYPLTIYDLDKASGAITPRAGTADAGSNPSYLALHPNRRFLYAANESDDDQGGLTALSIAADGSLTRLNHVTGSDGGFTFVAIDPSGSYALGASFNGGSISVFAVAEDGSLGPELDTQDFGDGSQSHSVGFDPLSPLMFIPNRGNDEVALLQLGADGQLSPHSPAAIEADPGSGPRHIAIRADGAFAYVINEVNSSLRPYQISADPPIPGESISTLPLDYNGQNSGAHIELSPNGRFVYGSNRGHDSIVAFEADAQTGALTLLGHTPTRGRTPRDFDVDPNGEWLLVANQDDALLSVFQIGADGSLTALGEPIAGPVSPTAVQFHYLDE
jgi:6-phosphogluconolactonase